MSNKVTFTWPYNGNLVYLSGSFNAWGKYKMNKDDDNVHTIDMMLNEGVYQYKFIVDGKWCYDILKNNVSDGFSSMNNIINVIDENNVDKNVDKNDNDNMHNNNDVEKLSIKNITSKNMCDDEKKYDIVISTGDVLKKGTKDEIVDFTKKLSSMNAKITALNLSDNDMKLLDNDPNIFKHIAPNVNILNINSISINDITDREKYIKIANPFTDALTTDIDIAVTYTSDINNNNLFETLKKSKPRYNICNKFVSKSHDNTHINDDVVINWTQHNQNKIKKNVCWIDLIDSIDKRKYKTTITSKDYIERPIFMTPVQSEMIFTKMSSVNNMKIINKFTHVY
jgi:hypothetical protein